MLPEGYIENYEQIAVTFGRSFSIETFEIANLIDLFWGHSNFRPDTKVVDIGCGNGHILAGIRSFKTTGLDISYNQCKHVLGYKISSVQADAQATPFKNDSFDVAICTDLFEHVPDEKKLIDEIDRVLRYDGILFFACPLGQDLSYYDSPEYEKKYRYIHLRSVSRELLTKRFSNFKLLNETMITSHMAKQKSPYPIVFRVYTKGRE